MTVAVSFERVSRHFGAVRAVDDVSLTITEGEFFAMLGPSGSGKTTCLRLIAGFEQPTSGHIEIFGETAEGLPPYRRNVNTVFQDYALFPHMTILDNVAYGLMVKGIARTTREAKARDALAMVALKTLQRNLGITFVFVTHDQGEALSMADRVAIFNEGRIVQIGAPEDIYERPRTRFVADFVGSSNVLSPEFVTAMNARPAWTSLRPEKIAVLENGVIPPPGRHTVRAKVASVHYQGAVTRLAAEADGHTLTVAAPSAQRKFALGEIVTLAWADDAMHAMEGEA